VQPVLEAEVGLEHPSRIAGGGLVGVGIGPRLEDALDLDVVATDGVGEVGDLGGGGDDHRAVGRVGETGEQGEEDDDVAHGFGVSK